MIDLKKYNGFYKNKLSRPVVFKLSKGQCNGCNKTMELNENYHIGHIIPQIEHKSFKLYYPELDVDNVLNLHALCSKCNLKANKYQTYSPFMLNQMFNENLRRIETRIEKIIKEEDFAEIYIIEEFLRNNPNIDLFSKTGKKYLNKDLLKTIKLIYEINYITPILKDDSGEYFLVDYNELLLKVADLIVNIDGIEEINSKLNSLNYSRIERIEVKSRKLLVKNRNKIKRILKENIIEIGEEVIKI